MKKRGLFGGTFDPIHFGHLYIAEEALNRLGLESVLFMPSGNPPHKSKRDKTDAVIRYELVNMAIRNKQGFEISAYEINSKEISYTYKTLEYLNEQEPDTSWYFITGADCLIELDSWKKVDEIFKHCTLVVFNRPGYEKAEILSQKKAVEERYGIEIMFLEVIPFDVSSTELKNMFKEGRNFNHLMPENVQYAVTELELYKDWEDTYVE